MTPRSVRNNNPGNLNSGPHWQGLMPRAKMTSEQAAEERFAVFENPKMGFRALGIVLLNYGHLYGLRTINQIFDRYAPPVENNTAGYKQRVSKETGVGIDETLNLRTHSNLVSIMKAIATIEGGGWFFSDTDLSDGAALALD